MSNDKNVLLENDNGEIESNYQPPPQKSIEEIVAADQEDESLRKYKEALLGAAQSEKIIVGMIRSNIHIYRSITCILFTKIIFF